METTASALDGCNTSTHAASNNPPIISTNIVAEYLAVSDNRVIRQHIRASLLDVPKVDDARARKYSTIKWYTSLI